MVNHCLATTMDNVYNPFTHFDEWFAYDTLNHYNTCQLVAYFSNVSQDLNDEDYNDEVSKGIDRLLEISPFPHIKVYENDADTFIPLANKAYKKMISEI